MVRYSSIVWGMSLGMKKYSREVTEALKRDEVTGRETESALVKI